MVHLYCTDANFTGSPIDALVLTTALIGLLADEVETFFFFKAESNREWFHGRDGNSKYTGSRRFRWIGVHCVHTQHTVQTVMVMDWMDWTLDELVECVFRDR